MDKEKPLIASTSEPTKTSPEGSICSEKSRKEGDSGNAKRTHLARPKVALSNIKTIHENVTRLHTKTTNVRLKLSNLRKENFPLKGQTDLINALTLRIADTPPNTPNGEIPSEQDLLREIERLQGLVKKLQLQNKTSDTTSSEIQQQSKKEECSKKPDSGEEKEEEKKSRARRKSKRKAKKITDEAQLQEQYVNHINEIVNMNAKVKDLNIPEFKNGDDLEEFAAKCVEAGLGEIVEAEVRVNAKNNNQAFITVESGSDAMINSKATRRYAMHGDIVKAFIKNKNDDTRESVGYLDESIPFLDDLNETIDDPEEVLVKDVEALKRDRAFVIRIVKECGNRTFVGSIAFKNPTVHDDGSYFKFKTRDTKAPIMNILVESCSEFLKQDESDDIVGFLYVAQVIKIEENGRCLGKLVAPVGKCDHLESELKAILMNNHLSDVKPFEQRFEDLWADPVTIKESDLENREDLRKQCVFTIDPLTARDLDDAVSCRKLDNGRYEIGVHISDVAHYLEESSELDELVKLRATSIYLVNEVIHMLPQKLCMKCSLLPNEDKFAFSVFWVMDEDANVISTEFTRSVINSCTQFAYEHAQKIIDNPDETFTDEDFPTIHNGFTVSDIVERVKILDSLAKNMRIKRFKNGSLSINKPQFYFEFDPKTGEPTSYEISDRQTANYLIEEFMLLANQSVAHMIYKSFPDLAFLRSHQAPKPSAIRSLKAKLNAVDIELDMSSSHSIYEGLTRICSLSKPGLREEVSAAMNYLLTKPMMRAKYFCSENVQTETELRHYALAIPIYTHFTSPIRRYPDILVHRLLAAAMKFTPVPKRTPEELHQLARICNDQKLNAKNAGEESSNLYFKRYIKNKGFIVVNGVVVDIYQHCLEVITLETGHLILVPFKLQKLVIDSKKAPAVVYISPQNSTKPPIELKLFSPVCLRLMVYEGRLTGFFDLIEDTKKEKNKTAKKKRRRASKAAKREEKDLTDDISLKEICTSGI